MLKREIKYTDFNGDETSDICYFNFSKPELIEMQVEVEGGFGQMLQNIIDAKDNKAIVGQIKDIILRSYGEKSPDGKRFIKNDQLREEFSQTAAFQELFMQLALDENAAVEFIKGTFPKDMVDEVFKPDKPVLKSTQMPPPPSPLNPDNPR